IVMIFAECSQRLREIQLIEVIVAIKGKRRTKVVDGKFEIAMVTVNDAPVIHVGGDRMLAGVGSVKQASNGYETRHGEQGKCNQCDGRFLSKFVEASPVHRG